jgi:hypothetical protein
VHNATENQRCIFINNAMVVAIPAESRVDGRVAQQQQLYNVNVTFRGGDMYGVPPNQRGYQNRKYRNACRGGRSVEGVQSYLLYNMWGHGVFTKLASAIK